MRKEEQAGRLRGSLRVRQRPYDVSRPSAAGPSRHPALLDPDPLLPEATRRQPIETAVPPAVPQLSQAVGLRAAAESSRAHVAAAERTAPVGAGGRRTGAEPQRSRAVLLLWGLVRF